MATFYDTHAHLDYPDFANDFAPMLERAQAAGITKLISIGTDLESSRRAIQLAEAHSCIYAVVGWHPNDATAAPAAHKEAALVFATRLIDSQFQFGGSRANETQALQWPREGCPDPDAAGGSVPGGVVPKAVVDATCEMARELLIVDRTAAPAGEELKYQNIAPNQVGYDKKDTRPVISHVAQAMLAKLGALIKSRSAAVRLLRT